MIARLHVSDMMDTLRLPPCTSETSPKKSLLRYTWMMTGTSWTASSVTIAVVVAFVAVDEDGGFFGSGELAGDLELGKGIIVLPISWSAEARDPNKRALLPAALTPAEFDSSKPLGPELA